MWTDETHVLMTNELAGVQTSNYFSSLWRVHSLTLLVHSLTLLVHSLMLLVHRMALSLAIISSIIQCNLSLFCEPGVRSTDSTVARMLE